MYRLINRKPLLRSEQKNQKNLSEQLNEFKQTLIDLELKMRNSVLFKTKVVAGLFLAIYTPLEIRHVQENGLQGNIFTLTADHVKRIQNRTPEKALEIQNVF
jgi:hypothetical protein